MALASDSFPPSVPRSVITPPCQRKAWLSLVAVRLVPTTCPRSLRPRAADVLPPRVPRSTIECGFPPTAGAAPAIGSEIRATHDSERTKGAMHMGTSCFVIVRRAWSASRNERLPDMYRHRSALSTPCVSRKHPEPGLEPRTRSGRTLGKGRGDGKARARFRRLSGSRGDANPYLLDQCERFGSPGGRHFEHEKELSFSV